MAVSSLRRPLLRYSMTLASPCMLHSRCRGPSGPLVRGKARSHYRGEQPGRIGRTNGPDLSQVSGRCFRRKPAIGVPMRGALAVRTSGTAGLDAGAEGFGLDGARASAAFGAAAKAAIDLLGVARKRLSGIDGIADIVVAEHVAGADNH